MSLGLGIDKAADVGMIVYMNTQTQTLEAGQTVWFAEDRGGYEEARIVRVLDGSKKAVVRWWTGETDQMSIESMTLNDPYEGAID